MSEVKRLNTAVIGVGYWGKNYVRILRELDQESNLLCVCDLIPAAVQAFKQQFPELETSTNVADMLSRFPQIDVVVVVTPATTHYAVVKECLDAGKHVLVEKPLTTEVEDGQKLVDLAKEKGLYLLCGHTFLFNKGVHEVKKLMNEKEQFGKLYYMYATRSGLGPIRKDVGAVWDLVPHDISIMQYLMDNVMPVSVSAVGHNVLKTNNNLVDNSFITLTYPSGVIANVHASWVNQEKVRQFKVVGSGRKIIFDDMNAAQRVKYIDNGATEEGNEIKLNANQTNYVAPTIPPFEPLKDQVRHFLSCVRAGYGNATLLSDGQLGVDVVKIMLAIHKSMDNAGAPVQIN